MKICTFFLVALTTFVFITPVNAQKQKAAKTPLVPCTIPLADSPAVREIKLNKPILYYQTDVAIISFPFARPASSDGYPVFNFEVSATPRNPKPTQFSPELIEQTRRYEAARGKKTADSKEPLTVVKDQSKNVKNMVLRFYSRDNPTLYSFQINYLDTLAFESDQQIKEIFAANLQIPAGSWVQIQDPELIKKIIGDIFSLATFNNRAPELKFWQADCNGWRAVYVTTLENNGLSLIISNSDVVDNFEKLKAASDKLVLDDKRKKTGEIFRP